MRQINRAVKPILSIAAVVITAGLLVAAIVFTEMGPQWAIFLTGVLVAAALSLASRASRSEWIMARRSAKIAQLQDKLSQEQRNRRIAELNLESSRLALDLFDTAMPKMIFYTDRGGIIRLHNRSFRDWLGRPAENIDGKPLSEIIGNRSYEEFDAALKKVQLGDEVLIEHSFTNMQGQVGEFLVQLLPSVSADKTVAGVLAIVTKAHIPSYSSPLPREGNSVSTLPGPPAAPPVGAEQSLFVDIYSEDVSGSSEAVERILGAIKHNDFCLFCQRIAPLPLNAEARSHYEIFVRLNEEEEGLVAPGVFFPLVEKHGLMPRLDRWVVEHAVQWASSSKGHDPAQSSLFINLAGSTLCDPMFPAFVGEQLKKYHLPQGALCFEVTDANLTALRNEVVQFVGEIRPLGCCVALSSFGRSGISFNSQHGLSFDFIKIDGALVLSILRDPMDASRVAAITKIAKTIGARTVAELVESDACISRLQQIGVDYVQGLGVSAPSPLVMIN